MVTTKVVSTKEEKHVIFLVISILIFLEVAIRLTEERLSGNIAHISAIPSLINQISETQGHSNLIFLGNSLTNNAVNAEHLESLEKINNEISVYKITPDGTAIADWYCIYNQNFPASGKDSSLVVIGFAWGQLSDQFPINPTRLGGFFCGIKDAPALESTGLTGHQQFLRFLAGSASHVYANREAIRNRVLDMVVPYYKELTQELNHPLQTPVSPDKKQNSASYTSLINLAEAILKSNRHLVVMAMPVMEDYKIDPELLATLRALEVPLLDLRYIDKIDKSNFLDPIHLNSEGSKIFSEVLATNLMSFIKYSK
jgi:hypothetical protein